MELALRRYSGTRSQAALPSVLQDRHIIVRQLTPDPGADWAGRVAPGVERSLVAVFDGHKRSDSAEMACTRMPEMLAGCGRRPCTPLHSCTTTPVADSPGDA